MNQQPTPQPTQPTETPPQPTQPPQPTHQFSSQDPNVKAKHRITFFTKVTTPADRAKQRQLRIAIVALSTLVLIGLTLLTLFLTIWRRPVVTPPQPPVSAEYIQSIQKHAQELVSSGSGTAVDDALEYFRSEFIKAPNDETKFAISITRAKFLSSIGNNSLALDFLDRIQESGRTNAELAELYFTYATTYQNAFDQANYQRYHDKLCNADIDSAIKILSTSMLEVFTDEPLDQALAKFQTYIDARTEDADKSALYALRAELLYQTCTFTCVNQILDDAKLADQLAPTATTALKVYQYGVWLDTVDSVKDYFYTAIDRDPEVIKKEGNQS